MKKLTAIVLALVLLLSCAAFAEADNAVFTMIIADPVVSVQSEQGNYDVNLEGLEVLLTMGLSGNTPSIEVLARTEAEDLLHATLQCVDSVLYMAIDGVSRPLAVDLSASGGMADSVLASALVNPETLMNSQLPAFKGVDIPKADLIGLASLLGGVPETDASGAQVVKINVPYEMINQLLSMIGQYRSMLPEALQSQLGFLFDMLEGMEASDSGFALAGTITDDGATSTLDIDVLPASGGVTAETPALGLRGTFQQNQDNLDVQVYQDGEAMTVASAALTSIPENAELNASLDIMGMIGATFSLYTEEEGQQVAAFELNASGQSMRASLTYGELEGYDSASFTLDVPDQALVNIFAQSELDAYPKNGLISADFQAQGNAFSFTANTQETIDEADFVDIQDLDSAVDVNSLSQDDSQELSQELQTALSGLMNFVVGAVSQQPAA